MDAPDRHNGQRDKRTDGQTDEETRLFVRPSVRSFVSSWSLTLTNQTLILTLTLYY